MQWETATPMRFPVRMRHNGFAGVPHNTHTPRYALLTLPTHQLCVPHFPCTVCTQHQSQGYFPSNQELKAPSKKYQSSTPPAQGGCGDVGLMRRVKITESLFYTSLLSFKQMFRCGTPNNTCAACRLYFWFSPPEQKHSANPVNRHIHRLSVRLHKHMQIKLKRP